MMTALHTLHIFRLVTFWPQNLICSYLSPSTQKLYLYLVKFAQAVYKRSLFTNCRNAQTDEHMEARTVGQPFHLNVTYAYFTPPTLSCLIRVGSVNWIGDKSRQFWGVLNIFETEQLQIGNWVDRSRQDKSVLSRRQFSSHHRHGQYKTVLSGLCRRCEFIGIGVSKSIL